jgi:vang-like
METESVRSARSEPAQRSHRHRSHRHGGGRHSSRAGGSEVGQPIEHQRLRGPYETDPDTDRDDRSVSTRASHAVRRGDRDRDSQWGETTTVVTGATSEFNYSLEDVNADSELEAGLGYRCARYAGSVLVGIVSILAFLSPVAMVILPKVGIAEWYLEGCGPDCEGMLIGFGFKLLILAGGSWALFVRRPRTTMPRIVISRAVVLVLTFVLVFSYWLFYGVRIFQQQAGLSFVN